MEGKKQVLLIGASGFVGKKLAEYLAKSNKYMVHCLVRNYGKLAINHMFIKLIKGDITDQAGLNNAAKGKDIIISCIGAPIGEEVITFRTEAAKNIVTAAKENNIKRIIAIGGSGICNIGNKMVIESEEFPK